MSATTLAANAGSLTEVIESQAKQLGFSLVGFCPAIQPTGIAHLSEWLALGYAGEMDYLAERRTAYEHPRHVLDGVRSIVMLGLPYSGASGQTPAAGQGRVSRYAWSGADYHDVIHDKLKRLVAVLLESAPAARARGVVDTAPLLEREFAQLAGLGWIGKNTLLINKPAGSYFFLAALLTDVTLVYDEAFSADHCGTCRACLDACPTQAFVQPYVLDASRCISYLTIEHKSPIARDLRPGIGEWLFGCDVCQDVCPWNHKAADAEHSTAVAAALSMKLLDLIELFELNDDAFRQSFRHTPMWRPKRRGILRNAAIVLGNQRAVAAIPALTRGLCDSEPLIRGASAWALGQIAGQEALNALTTWQKSESDTLVVQEIDLAIHSAQAACSQSSPP
jgi:epoxyqueuosine reductase